MKRTMLLLCVLGAIIAIPGAAFADSGTFSGSVSGTTCGPKQPIQVTAGETTIHVVATADVAANDITLELFDPVGTQVAHGDTITSPEELTYSSVQPHAWHLAGAGLPLHGRARDGSGLVPRDVGNLERPGRRSAGLRPGPYDGRPADQAHQRQPDLQSRDRRRPAADRG